MAAVMKRSEAADRLLLTAVAAGDIETCVQLIHHGGASANAINANGTSVLHLAAAKGDLALMQYLIQAGADLDCKETVAMGGYTPLHFAVQMNNLEAVELLLKYGANPSATEDLHGFAPLHQAARLGNNQIAKYLVAKGADVHQKDKDGNNASFWARELDNEEFLTIPGIPPPMAATVEERLAAAKAKKEAAEALASALKGGKKKASGDKKGKKKKK